MKQLNAKLIVSDFDGTLLNSNHEISEEVRKAIAGYVADGGIFAVCTGRMLASILPRVRELGLKGLVIACQGTVIADIESGELVKNSGLSPEQAVEICKTLEAAGYYINVYSGESLVTDIPADNEYLKRYEKITGIAAMHTDMPLSLYVEKNRLTCQKIASLCFPEDRERIYLYLCDRFADQYEITCSADVLVEIGALGENKGQAVRYLAGLYNIDMADTVAVGDNLNDLSMIIAAGTGVAVDNAVGELKDKADFVTVSNDDGAIAKVIAKFGYKRDD